MIKLITNASPSKSHFSLLEELLSDADEAYISVAFLKLSGVKKIEPYFKRLAKVQILAGANFGFTEPEALTLIHRYTGKGAVSGYLTGMDPKVIFHPKMYLVRSGKTGHIIVGSANLTGGGLENNIESSLYHRCQVDERIWIESLAQFNLSIAPGNARELSDILIAQYRSYHKKQKEVAGQLEPFPDVSESLFFDLERLKWHFDNRDKDSYDADIALKRRRYKKAKKVLESIRTTAMTKSQFEDALEQLVGSENHHQLWHSRGMFRRKSDVFKHRKQFRRLVEYIHGNLDKSAAIIYDKAKEISDGIKGVGPNYIGEILVTYAPIKFANINRNPITVLREEGSVDIPGHTRLFKGGTYEEYNNIVQEISNKLGLKDLLEADYFFDTIYKKIQSELRGDS